ncbi:hypothetical protein FN846DRAFT_911343 [Sphaerosporella brunnea]|uniref:Uncharacterized protein n=1 Tax=Sphaerosporella brunnea TaxID=1250544 RepID=A0A5J5ELB0_9PEZI|nr:hypothetical protein FN846DRAFT_911343 [Sphaerosporella brunnea]
MTRPSKRTIISRQPKAIGKRRRLAEAEAEAVFSDEVENEGEPKEDGEAEENNEAEEDDSNREAVHKSLETYINTFQVHNGADPDPDSRHGLGCQDRIRLSFSKQPLQI